MTDDHVNLNYGQVGTTPTDSDYPAMDVHIKSSDVDFGSGGGAATVADGADVALGAKANTAATATDATAFSVISLLKGLLKILGFTNDTAVSTDADGSVSAKLRGLIVVLLTTGIKIFKVQGAANVAVAQLATSTTAATLVAARATRRGVTIRNHDTSISVYVGPATVTSSNGLLLKAGESVFVTWVGLIQVIAASGTPTVGTWDEYD